MLATIVGADSLSAKADVSQPRILIPVETEVENEFEQQKYKEYLSSSSRSASPRMYRRASSKKARWTLASDVQQEDLLATAELVDCNAPPTSDEAEVVDLNPLSKDLTADSMLILSKRARQRWRQRLAHQLAKALEPVDGIRYEADLKFRMRQAPQQRASDFSSKSATKEQVRVKRMRLTIKERIQKHRALLTHARVLMQEAQKLKEEEVVKKPPRLRQVWKPKSKPASKTTRTAPEVVEKREPPNCGSARTGPPNGGSHLNQADLVHFAPSSLPAVPSKPPTAPVPVLTNHAPPVEPHSCMDLFRFKMRMAESLGPLHED